MSEKLVKYIHMFQLRFLIAFQKQCPNFETNPYSFQYFLGHNLIFVIQSILGGNFDHEFEYFLQIHISFDEGHKEEPRFPGRN